MLDKEMFNDNEVKDVPTVSFRLILIYIIPILTVFPNLKNIVSIVVLVLLISLWNRDELFYAFPAILYFYLQLTIGNLSLCRCYSILVLLRVIVNRNILKEPYKKRVLCVVVCIMYSILVVFSVNMRKSLFIIVDILFIWVFVAELESRSIKERFWKYFIYAALGSSVYGIINGATYVANEMLNGKYSMVQRYLATFNDPNYTGFFINIAILICFAKFNELENKILAYISIGILYFTLLRTISTTAIICNLLLLLLFFILKKNKKVTKVLGAILLIVFGLYILLSYAYLNSDTTTGIFLERITEKLSSFRMGDYNSFTTGRTTTMRFHLDFYWNQNSILKILFGGNGMSSAYMDTRFFTSAAHNEYIDCLLCVGIIGFLLTYGIEIGRLVRKIYQARYDDVDLAAVLVKVGYLLYCFTLTVFLDFRFMFFLLL